MKTDGGVDILDVRARTILVANNCGVGHLGGGSKVIDHGGDGVWLSVGESDGEGHSFVALKVGVGRFFNRLGDFYNNG